jgi:hypothetical protein
MAKTNINGLKKNADTAQAIIAMINTSSETGHLIADSEIVLRVIKEQQLTTLSSSPETEVGSILNKIVEVDHEIFFLAGLDGSRLYYTSRFMTEAYAVMLLHKRDDHFHLIAEVVRQNSKSYPRPVPLDMFCEKPFEFTNQEVMDSLALMSKDNSYGDIVKTTTSTSRIFLYSLLHLEPEHASMLAEWFDVGRSNNP